jgi:hypothetical protein
MRRFLPAVLVASIACVLTIVVPAMAGGFGSAQGNAVTPGGGGLAAVLAVSADGNAVDQTNLGSLTTAAGEQVSSPTVLATTAVVVGAATTSGVLLDLESGAGGSLAVRDGDDSNYANVAAYGVYTRGGFGISATNADPLGAFDVGLTRSFAGGLGISDHAQLASTGTLAWTSGSLGAAATQDTGLARSAAGVVKITDGSSGSGYLLAKQAMVVVERLTAQSIANGGEYISWGTETRDDLAISAVGGGANTKAVTFTAAGVWSVNVGVQWAANVVGLRGAFLEVYDSGDVLKWGGIQLLANNGASGVYMSLTETIRVASGDYVKILAYQTSGGALDAGSASPYTHATFTRQGL